MREPVPTNRFEKPFPLLTRLILWTGYPPFPFRSWIAPMVDKLSDLAPNLCLLDFYIHLPPSDSKKTLRATFGDFREISPLFRSISSKKNFRVVRFWLWERDGTLEDQHYLEGTFKRLIYENGWDGSVAFVWRVLWTEIWPFCDDPIDRWF
ncbi:hypothetical protein DL96DRAFT_1635516 [Flagelloscypha sp. PMI_526]|nr:hypothetical protein DL96DRAFT_1635516 [Flagelloscypha sp. PMI_526]